eukprot:312989-Amphidinium_carterae.1
MLLQRPFQVDLQRVQREQAWGVGLVGPCYVISDIVPNSAAASWNETCQPGQDVRPGDALLQVNGQDALQARKELSQGMLMAQLMLQRLSEDKKSTWSANRKVDDGYVMGSSIAWRRHDSRPQKADHPK